MYLSNQVCNIEIAKQLQKLGVSQNSIFKYVNNWANPRCEPINDGEHIIMSEEMHLTRRKGLKRGYEVNFTAAYTVAELGVLIPSNIVLPKHVTDSICEQGEIPEMWSFYDRKTSYSNFENEADARGQLLVDLIEVCNLDISKINLQLDGVSEI